MQSLETVIAELFRTYPLELRTALVKVMTECPEMYLAGGTVRDLLSGRIPHDLDLTVPERAMACAGLLARRLGAAFVPLDEEEGVGRVVWREYTVDFSQFREGTTTIEADLARRDFTINAMAVPLEARNGDLTTQGPLLDPTHGRRDFTRSLIRATTDRIFQADPLRLLRAYRFAATFGFTLDGSLQKLIHRDQTLLRQTAAERVSSELRLIMASDRAHEQITAMATSGLLWVIFPELEEGVGVDQPASHHLDVFGHALAALYWMEHLLADCRRYFPAQAADLQKYLAAAPSRRIDLKWAALFHDLGKPAARGVRNERLTFYGHDRLGAEKFMELASRLRWSREDTARVARLIELHMWPFHLSNANRKTGITARAILRLVKAAGSELPSLFLLALADSLAGQGPGKPPEMEESLADLYGRVEAMYQQSIKPVFEQPRLLTGHDVRRITGLNPCPLIGRLLRELEEAQVSGEVRTREEAEAWLKRRIGKLER